MQGSQLDAKQARVTKPAKVKGAYKGRQPTIRPAAVAALKSQGLGASAIAKRLGIGRASVKRMLESA